MNDDEKRCPRCAETVKKQAAVCRFCQYNFSRPAGEYAPPPQQPNVVYTSPPKNSFQSCMGCVGIGVAIVGGVFFFADIVDKVTKATG
jgi:hypothetical protein